MNIEYFYRLHTIPTCNITINIIYTEIPSTIYIYCKLGGGNFPNTQVKRVKKKGNGALMNVYLLSFGIGCEIGLLGPKE